MTQHLLDSPDSAAPPTAVHSPSSGPRSLASRLWSAMTNAVLTVLAAAGVVCIAATIAAVAFDITLIMFKTGSMSPTIPSGSLAVVRQVPASEVRIGDVVTISRGEGELPITHRVTAITPAENGAFDIEMKGDANPTADPAPYHVTTVKKVLWHAPNLAFYVARFATPPIMGLITLVSTAIVVWAFWPRRGH